MGGRQIIVLDSFVVRSLFSGGAGGNCSRLDVGCGVCIRDGYVHAKGFPRDQGTSVAPSGLLPSLLDNPIGSFLNRPPNTVVKLGVTYVT